MTGQTRSTLVVQGRLAMKEARLAAARGGDHGLRIMSFEQLAVRLAGGFIHGIDKESLRAAVKEALPDTDMGELEGIKTLPGMIDAAAATLYKAWRAEIDLGSRAKDHPRLDAIARLEAAVLERLPPGMKRPVDITAAAKARIAHAPAILGSIEIRGHTELSPCWRPLLAELTQHIPVRWNAGPRSVPSWLEDTGVTVARARANEPEVGAVSAATPYHEAVEAMRWARSLLASGVPASEIAIAAASTAEYDGHFLALRAESNIDLHFVHGLSALATRDGQAAAALADIVVHGLSQARLRRLAGLVRDGSPFEALPKGWIRALPADAPLATPDSWDRFLKKLTPDMWPDRTDHAPRLREAVETLMKGAEAAEEIGEAFLKRGARAIWRKALRAGPEETIDATIGMLSLEDGLEAPICVVWMPASALASSPRSHVRLLGLNSSRWPRSIEEDRLIPNHIIPTRELDPLPVNLADRRDFETICATTEAKVSLSRARRGQDGRLLGRSPLLDGHGEETYLRRNAIPEHAFSETDRLTARPKDFATDGQAVSARACWRDWHRSEITGHDGLVQADHPLMAAILDRTQSAKSLGLLLRNPLGFVWTYAFGWREPESGAETLTLDALGEGNLVHAILERALRGLETANGLGPADAKTIEAAVAQAAQTVAAEWEDDRPVPPAIVWERTLDDARAMAVRALSHSGDALADARSFAEVPFGRSEPDRQAAMPWDANAPVEISGTGFRIAGYIDRLDISGDGNHAAVCDYKTGRPPRDEIVLKGGSELQRCLYAFAVKALLGENVATRASLLYLREEEVVDLPLDDPDAALAEIKDYLRAARASIKGGAALPGPDTADTYDDLAFALPANAVAVYCKRKFPAVEKRLGDATRVWDAE